MKFLKYGSYYLITAIYSVVIGVLAWSFLFIVNTVIHFLWIGEEGSSAFMYDHKLLIFPLIFGVSMILAYIYSNYEVIPRPGILYAKEFREHKKVSYKDFTKVYVLAMIPLFIGSSVGPEAALVGLVFMLSGYIGDVTDRLEAKIGVEIIEEPKEKFLDNLKANPLYLSKIVIIYVVVAFTTLELLGHDRFPPFNVSMPPIQEFGWIQLIEVIPLIAVGYLLAKFYQKSEPVIEHFFERFTNQYLKMTITAVALSFVALTCPLLIMSGEATLHTLVDHPLMASGYLFIALAFLKIIITHICISGDLRGGHIFPIIYSAFLMGGGLSQILGLDPTLAIATVTATMTMTIFSNTIAIFMLLALFFPIRILTMIFLIVLLISERRAAANNRSEL